MKTIYSFLLLIFTSCSSDANKGPNNIEDIKQDFISTILTESALDEGPFQMDYHLRAILFSDNVVSLTDFIKASCIERRLCSSFWPYEYGICWKGYHREVYCSQER